MPVEPDENGEWPTPDEWPSIQAVVTCRYEGCPAENVPYTVTLYENVEPPIYRSHCAGCNTDNDDIVPIE